MSTQDGQKRALDAVAALLRDTSPPRSGDVKRREGRARLLARIDREADAPRRYRTVFGVVLAAAALLLGVVGWQRLGGALRYELVGAELEGPYIRAAAGTPVVVRFSDDTSISAAAGARLRIEETTRVGARILVERGHTRVHVVHRDRTNWTFLAGPFEVRVVGTRFELDWDPTREALDLTLQEGSVEVRAPFGSGPLRVAAGQRFHGDVSRRSLTLVDGSDAPPAPSTAAVAAAPAPSTSGLPDAAATSSSEAGAAKASASPVARPSWAKRIVAGQFEALLTEATERGIPQCLQHCSAGELSALADAARYTGRNDLARDSLQALRSRFRSSNEGRSALFTLGRLYERQGNLAAARGAYDAYLSENPAASLAAEALGGKLRVVLATDGKRAAAPLAEEYLRRYPNGVQAGVARQVLGSH